MFIQRAFCAGFGLFTTDEIFFARFEKELQRMGGNIRFFGAKRRAERFGQFLLAFRFKSGEIRIARRPDEL